jgi:hypothetical protein
MIRKHEVLVIWMIQAEDGPRQHVSDPDKGRERERRLQIL